MHKHPKLRFGIDTERNVLWVVTSIGALVITIMLVTEAIVNWAQIYSSTYRLTVTLSLCFIGCLWIMIPVLANKKFPHWAGLLSFFSIMAGVAYHLAFSHDPFSVNTSLHMLPIASLYLGWFWRPAVSRVIFLGIFIVLLIAGIMSPVIAAENGIPEAVLFFVLMLATFSYGLGAFLRWKLQKKAMLDQLTGVLNLKGIRRVLAIDVMRAKRNEESFSIAVVDFDMFKKLNDTRGHSFGDNALVTTVLGWKSQSRIYDSIGRIGGDEFIFLFPRTNLQQASVILERLKVKSDFAWTYGLAQLKVDDTLESLLVRADEDLYLHKNKRTKNENLALATLEDETIFESIPTNFLQNFYRKQSNFSIMTAALSTMVFLSLIISLMVSGLPAGFSYLTMMLVLGTIATAVNIAFPLAMGNKYPSSGALWSSATILIIYTAISIFSTSFFGVLSLLYATSLLALYLGVFRGDNPSRLLQITGVAMVSGVLIIRYWSEETHHLLTIASLIYALITQTFLFEVGSYLYSRSRLHAHHDELTNVLNRHGLEEHGEAELRRARRGGYSLCVAVIDCVGFKKVNDTMGHVKGDAALRETAQHLVKHLEIYDIVARTGGDEFVLLLPYVDENEAKQKMKLIEKDSPLRWTVGVVEVESYETLKNAIKRADRSLYETREAAGYYS